MMTIPIQFQFRNWEYIPIPERNWPRLWSIGRSLLFYPYERQLKFIRNVIVSWMYQGWGLRRYLIHDPIINYYSNTSCVLIGLSQKSSTRINPSSGHFFTIQGKCPPRSARVFHVKHTQIRALLGFLTLRHPNPSSAGRKSQAVALRARH